MKFLGLIFIALIAIFFCDDDEFPLEKDVIILTDSNFDKAVEKYEYLLVLFKTPECEPCEKFYLEYEKAATVLRKENLYLAKVDASVENNLAEKFTIQEFPAVRLFIKEEIIYYTGGKNDSEIINWMRKQSGPDTKDLQSVEEVEKFRKDNDVVLIYFGSDKHDIAVFTRVARKNKDIPFAIVESKDTIKKFTKPQTIVLFKHFDEKRNELTDIKEKALNEFIEKYSYPKVMRFDEKAFTVIFGKESPAIMHLQVKNLKNGENMKN